MKICILEWICGGGISELPTGPASHNLFAEGKQMLTCLLDGARAADAEVTTVLDARFADRVSDSLQTAAPNLVPPMSRTADVLDLWTVASKHADACLVVAPELGGALRLAIDTLEAAGTRLINCSGEMLSNACDKWQTSNICLTHGIRHPPTHLLKKLDEQWLTETSQELGNAAWIVKPADGAGCERLQIHASAQELFELPVDPGSAPLMVQPWIAGRTFSCSAIVDSDATWHWLPLVEQSMTQIALKNSPTSRLQYAGGRVLPDVARPHELLEQISKSFASAARGWVSVDLVQAETSKEWYLIEVNPRCSTSIIGLGKAYADNLVAELLGIHSKKENKPDSWRECKFEVAKVP